MYFFNGNIIEIKKIQIIKVDQMIMFYNAMCYLKCVVDNCPFLYLGAICYLGPGSLTFIDSFSTDKTRSNKTRELAIGRLSAR